MALLEIKNLTFKYPRGNSNALNNINLCVDEGEFLLICGKSGCGKSTLLRQIKPTLSPHGTVGGEVLLSGRAVSSMDFRAQSSEIGFVMQDPQMQLVTDKVWHELAFGLENLGTDNRTMRVRIAEMASFFGIQEWFDRKVCDLSGGQKQILCLASVMVMQPKLILLDEPTSQLDPIAASEFLNTLKRINTELGTTVIITEHRSESLFPIADRVVFMQGGEIIECCKPREAADRIQNASELFCTLPTAMRIYAGTKPINAHSDVPLTVREGRRYLESVASADKTAVPRPKRARSGEKRSISTKKPLISMDEVWFRYERESNDVLKGISLEIFGGELMCIIGGNGAGKSTAIMNASGMYKPYRGKVKCDGKPIGAYKQSEVYGKQIGVLVQTPQCSFTEDTIEQELETTRRNIGMDKNEVREIIDLMEIGDILDRNPYDISGGELQRAAIAKLLILKPRILFLDEATKGMDAFFKIKFGGILKKLCSMGIGIVMVSHDIEFCAEYADRCTLLFDGAIAADGTPKEVFLNNCFYTTTANRIARGIIENAITVADVIAAVN